jgi:hypothetical protein
MTIVVGVAAPDGLIIAGDSRTSLEYGNGHHRIGSDFATKIFDVRGYGLATYGEALIDASTVAGEVNEFIARLTDRPSDVDDLATKVAEFFNERLIEWYREHMSPWDPSQGWKLGFIVAGYDAYGVGGLREVRLPGDPDADVIVLPPSTANPGFYPAGQIDVVNRLIAGVDGERLGASGVALPDDALDALAGLEYEIIHPLALQDAVDLAHFLIRTTIDMQRFSDGTRAAPHVYPSCGGPIATLAVRRRGAEWVDHHPLSKASRPGLAEGAH